MLNPGPLHLPQCRKPRLFYKKRKPFDFREKSNGIYLMSIVKSDLFLTNRETGAIFKKFEDINCLQ
jgi:hypothetical protein